jgi:branched-chain amino acid transport system substrate-binding protein
MRFVGHVLLPCFVGLALWGCKPRGEPEPILIGHVAPFSGPDKRIGEHARQAILLAVEQANKEGNRIAGRRVAVLHVDLPGDLDALQPVAVRLIKVNQVVALLGGANAAQVERLGHAAQPYQVALITPAAVPVERLAENAFSVNASLTFHGQVLARFAATELKAERVALLADSQRTASMVLADAFHREFSKGSQVSRLCIYKSGADLATAIEESKEAKPQAILYAGAAADLAKARTALQDAGLSMPVLLASDGEHLAALEANAKASKDLYWATPYVLDGGTPEQQEFAKEYQERFHEAPDVDALLAYDGVRVLFQAMRRTKGIDAAKVRAELARSEAFESLAGRLLFDKDHAARRPLFVVRFENGAPRDPKRFDSEAK